MENTQIALKKTDVQPERLTYEYAQLLLGSLFRVLEDATNDTDTTLLIFEKLHEFIQQNPVESKRIFTPDNVHSVLSLIVKIQNKTFHSTDIEKVFPDVLKFPLWPMLKGLIK